MNNCPNLFLLSTIACRLADTLTTDELDVLAASFTALGDLLALIVAKSQ